jgi:hypothetical protein
MNATKIKDTQGCSSVPIVATNAVPEPLIIERPAPAQTIPDQAGSRYGVLPGPNRRLFDFIENKDGTDQS